MQAALKKAGIYTLFIYSQLFTYIFLPAANLFTDKQFLKKSCKICVTEVTLRACLLLDVAHRQLLPEIDTDFHTQRPFNIQYLCHRDPRFRARDIHSAVCVRAKDRYLRIRPITYVCRRFVAKSRPCCRRDLLFIRLGGSLFEYSATYVKRRTWFVGRCYGIAVHMQPRKQSDKLRSAVGLSLKKNLVTFAII